MNYFNLPIADDYNNNRTYILQPSELSKVNIDYLKDSDIIDLSGLFIRVDDYPKIRDFIIKLDQNNKKCKVIIYVDKRTSFNNIFLNTTFKNVRVYVNYDNCNYSIKKYKMEEKEMDKITEPLNNLDLSPLELFLHIYSIVKNYKPYNLCQGRLGIHKSTALRYILFNEYIVCGGFSRLLKEICDRFGIDVEIISVAVGRFDKNGEIKKTYHSRCIVNIDDDEYDVHGLYMSDPTWDNNEFNDLYNHALMTFDQMQVSAEMFYYSFDEPILDIHNFMEYNEQINYMLKKELQTLSKYNYSYRECLHRAYFGVLSQILGVIRCDPKYDFFAEKLYNDCYNEEQYVSFINEFGDYLLTHINKKIDDKKLFSALYNSGLTEEGINEEIVFEDYLNYDLESFPYRIDKRRKHHLIKRKK